MTLKQRTPGNYSVRIDADGGGIIDTDETLTGQSYAVNLLYSVQGKKYDPCVYCGVISTTMDHIPSLSIAEGLIEFKGRFIIVPACSECNDTLANYKEMSIFSRRKYLVERYELKYRNILHNPGLAETFGVRVIRERLRNLEI